MENLDRIIWEWKGHVTGMSVGCTIKWTNPTIIRWQYKGSREKFRAQAGTTIHVKQKEVWISFLVIRESLYVFHTGLSRSWWKLGPWAVDRAWNTESLLEQHMLREGLPSQNFNLNQIQMVMTLPHLSPNSRLRLETFWALPAPSNHLQIRTKYQEASCLSFYCLLPECLVYVNPGCRHQGLSKKSKMIQVPDPIQFTF